MEASLILRNVSQVKATALEDAGKIRGRSGFVQDHRSLEQLAAVLIARGAAHAVDTTAVEEPPAAELAP